MNLPALPEDVKAMIRIQRFGVLATYGGEYPYTSLISLGFSDDLRRVFFPTSRQTRKYANLQHEARVSILIDNRHEVGKSQPSTYALTLLGTAREAGPTERPACQAGLIDRHPELEGFMSQEQVALVLVAVAKVILVERFQEVREFELPPA